MDWETLRGHAPVTVLAFAAVSGLLVATNTGFADVFGRPGPATPFEYLAAVVFHWGPGHYRGNVLLFVPFGIVLTSLTSNRHVLALVVLTHLPGALFYAALGSGGVGSSIAASGVAAATLVRAVGEGMQDASGEQFRVVLVGLLAPFLTVLLLVAILTGPGRVGHFGHFFGFLFGAGYEAVLVLVERSRSAAPVRV